jgi:hypothetical protein
MASRVRFDAFFEVRSWVAVCCNSPSTSKLEMVRGR